MLLSRRNKLLATIGPDRESAGERYLELRGNLIRFFQWRGCPFPEDHADETINRVARRIDGGEKVRDPTRYFLGVARLVALEIHKEQAKERQALGELTNSPTASYQFEQLEPRVVCLDRCLQSLPPDSSELILHYYRGEGESKIENRKRLTERFRVSLNTLRMRALRLRENLLSCVEDCLKT